VQVPQRFYGALLANRGQKVQEITQRCNVQIKFPERQGGRGSSAELSPRLNGHQQEEAAADASPPPPPPGDQDTIRIIGCPERCEQARELLLAEIPTAETLNVPFDLHRLFIGRNGQEIRRLMEQFGVSIRVPPQEQRSDEVVVSGAPARVREAVAAIMARVEEFEEEARDKVRSHPLRPSSPPLTRAPRRPGAQELPGHRGRAPRLPPASDRPKGRRDQPHPRQVRRASDGSVEERREPGRDRRSR